MLGIAGEQGRGRESPPTMRVQGQPVAFYDPAAAGFFGGTYGPHGGFLLPTPYFVGAGPPGSPVSQPPAQPGEPILAMDTLKTRINEAAPGEVKKLISSVQFVPRAAAFTSLIQMAAKAKQPQKAIEIFEAMSAVNVQPNTFSYSALISALARAGRWQEAESYFRELEAKAKRDPELQPNTVTYAALISAYEKGGQLDKALAAFERQLAARIPPDLITYSSLITACERAGNLPKASNLLDQLHAAGLVANQQLYHGLISACQVAGEWELALEVFLGMQCAGVRPNVHTVNLLLGALVAANQVAHALCLLREAVRTQYDLGTASFSSVLQLLAVHGAWREAAGVHRAMHLAGVAPDATSAGLLVAAAVQGGNQPLAARLAADFVAQGLLQPPPPADGPMPVPGELPGMALPQPLPSDKFGGPMGPIGSGYGSASFPGTQSHVLHRRRSASSTGSGSLAAATAHKANPHSGVASLGE